MKWFSETWSQRANEKDKKSNVEKEIDVATNSNVIAKVEDEITCSTDCWASIDFDDTLFERSRTISDSSIERGKSFDDEEVNSTTRDDDAENKKEDAIFELLRTILGTRLEKADNSDEDDMIVESNVDVEVVNLIEW